MIWLKEIDSTNEEIKRLAKQNAPDGLLVVADKQSMGKGRRGRSWESPDGSNIYMSLLLRPSFRQESAAMVTLVMALSVAEAIARMTKLDVRIKWPNDIVIAGKKAVGILTELAFEENGGFYLVCGVGINVNQRYFSEEISKTATSLLLECERVALEEQKEGKKSSVSEFDRQMLVEKVMEHFEANYRVFCQRADMTDLLDAYNALLVNKNAAVRVLDPKGEYEGTALGINKDGELLVQKADGSIEAVYAGEVSVRGIYGYV